MNFVVWSWFFSFERHVSADCRPCGLCYFFNSIFLTLILHIITLVMLELSPIFGHHSTKLYFKRLFRETKSPILSQCMHSVCEVKNNRTVSKWPADGTRSFISIFFFHFTKNQELGQNVLLLVCIYRCLELEAWRNNFVKRSTSTSFRWKINNKVHSSLVSL